MKEQKIGRRWLGGADVELDGSLLGPGLVLDRDPNLGSYIWNVGPVAAPKCRAMRGHQGTPDERHCRTASPTLLPVLVLAIPRQPLLLGGIRNVPLGITLSPGLH